MKKLAISSVKNFVNAKCEVAFSKFDNSEYKEFLKVLDEKYAKFTEITTCSKHDEASMAFLNSLQDYEQAYFELKQAEAKFLQKAQVELNAHTNVVEVFNEALVAIREIIPTATFERLTAIGGNVINALCVEKTKAKAYFSHLVFMTQDDTNVSVDTNKLECVIRLIQRFGALSKDKGKAIQEIQERIEGIFTLNEDEVTYIMSKLGYIEREKCDVHSFSLPIKERKEASIEDILGRINATSKREREVHAERLNEELSNEEQALQAAQEALAEASGKEKVLAKGNVKKQAKAVVNKRKEIEAYK